MDFEQAGLKRDLELERRAHEETGRYLGRALRNALYWKQEAERLGRGDPIPTPNQPPPLPTVCAGDGGGGAGADGLVALVFATIAGLGRVGEELAARPTDHWGGETGPLLQIARDRIELLVRAIGRPPLQTAPPARPLQVGEGGG